MPIILPLFSRLNWGVIWRSFNVFLCHSLVGSIWEESDNNRPCIGSTWWVWFPHDPTEEHPVSGTGAVTNTRGWQYLK